jgi:hypothetical protein
LLPCGEAAPLQDDDTRSSETSILQFKLVKNGVFYFNNLKGEDARANAMAYRRTAPSGRDPQLQAGASS